MGKVVIRGSESRLRAIEIVRNGGTFADASADTGYGVDYVRQLCTKAGIYNPKFSTSQTRRNKALVLLKNGTYAEDVMAICKYKSVQAVCNLAKRNGIEPLMKSATNRENRNTEIISLRYEGKSYHEIADILEINEPIVAQICRSNGIGGSICQVSNGVGRGEKRKCLACGIEFECSAGHNKKYCSEKCARSVYDSIYGAKRRASIVVVDNDISLKKLYVRDHGICHICGKITNWDDYTVVNGKKCVSKNYPTIDHIIPVSRGGAHSWDNIALAHMSCNASKCNRLYG